MNTRIIIHVILNRISIISEEIYLFSFYFLDNLERKIECQNVFREN